MHLHHQSVKPQVQGPLRHLLQQLATTSNMAGVSYNGHIGHNAAQFNRHLPKGVITVASILQHIEAAVHGRHICQPHLPATLDGTHP